MLHKRTPVAQTVEESHAPRRRVPPLNPQAMSAMPAVRAQSLAAPPDGGSHSRYLRHLPSPAAASESVQAALQHTTAADQPQAAHLPASHGLNQASSISSPPSHVGTGSVPLEPFSWVDMKPLTPFKPPRRKANDELVSKQKRVAQRTASPSSPPPPPTAVQRGNDAPPYEELGTFKWAVDVTSISRSKIYEMINPEHKRYNPSFPKPVKLKGVKATRFVKSEVFAWIKMHMEAR